MKSLSFMRHAESDLNQSDGSDFDRPIKNSGLKEIKICAEHLKKNNRSFELLFCSPALRTKLTAEYFLLNMNLEKIKVIDDYNLYEGSEENFLLRVSKLSKYQDILIVSHEPQILFFIDYFLSNTEFWQKVKKIDIVTSSIFTINFDVKMWNEINNINAISYEFFDSNYFN